jgi:hypothetical protein
VGSNPTLSATFVRECSTGLEQVAAGREGRAMESDNPFHRSDWPKSIVRPDSIHPGESLSLDWDFSVSGGEKKKLIAAWVEVLPTLRHLRRLRVWSHVTQPLFDAICTIGNLEQLQIKWSNVRSLDRIEGLSRLESLGIGSSTRVESIQPLVGLQGLEHLELENFKLVTDFSPLVDLRRLRSLVVTGSMWARQAIESLEPFSRMTWLESLCVDTSHVKSIGVLKTLTGLRFLGLGGRLPYEEYASLSVKLPHTECQRFQPYLDLSKSGYSACKACRRKSMVMVTGKGKPVLCQHCDAQKLANHVRLFEQAQARARADS